ncbi:hydroxymethylglutaryl-CoA reductase, degradative [Pendulispora albinea]|uniref:3-hydroxy-3-methylglutaryl coenzyme A reductase n=1 Tax=Pendulispora albinea TaxID=2741071 RepID=A0ABZ2MAE5_9BACT
MTISRIPRFYKLSVEERHLELRGRLGLDDEDVRTLAGGALSIDAANNMIENVISTHALPLGLGLNFRVNDRDYIVPMCVEEPSVVAAASNAAKSVRDGGGFTAEADPPIMIAQVQLVNVPDTEAATEAILSRRASLLEACDEAIPSLVRRGGGARDIEVRTLVPSTARVPSTEHVPGTEQGRGMLAVHLLVDCQDAMGANMVNTVAEAVAGRLAALAGGEPGLRILSNLADRRRVRVRCLVPLHALETKEFSGERVRDGVIAASRFAELDPYRAATHNKGVMNGVDAVTLATGNDWRGVEAGAHAYAARDGRYRPLSIWRLGPGGVLQGELEMPMVIGTVGGTTRAHPGARLALKLLGNPGASELGMVIASVGLASNLSALRALACEGIQRGHMSLHARSVAMTAGATGALVEQVARELSELGDVRLERAVAILARIEAESRRPAAAHGIVAPPA